MFRFTGAVRSVWDFRNQVAHTFVDGVFETEDEGVAEFLRGHPGVSELTPAKSKQPSATPIEEPPARQRRHKKKEEA